jgi:hypothetical protein
LIALFFLRSSAICPKTKAIRNTIVQAFFPTKDQKDLVTLFPKQEEFFKSVAAMMAINPNYLSFTEDTPSTYARIYFVLLAKEILKQKLVSEKNEGMLRLATLYHETFLGEAISDYLSGNRSSGGFGSHLNTFIAATALHAITESPSGLMTSYPGIDPISKRARQTLDQMKSALVTKIDGQTQYYLRDPKSFTLSYHNFDRASDPSEGAARTASYLAALTRMWTDAGDTKHREAYSKFLSATIEELESSLFDLQMNTLINPQFHDFGQNGIGAHYYFGNIALITPYIAQEKATYDRAYRPGSTSGRTDRHRQERRHHRDRRDQRQAEREIVGGRDQKAVVEMETAQTELHGGSSLEILAIGGSGVGRRGHAQRPGEVLRNDGRKAVIPAKAGIQL